MRRDGIAAQERVGADLPQHEIGLLGDNALLEAGEHIGGGFAAHAAVDHPESMARETPPDSSIASRAG